MDSTVNEILERFDSLSIEDQETILEIERKRLIQKKRESLIEELKLRKMKSLGKNMNQVMLIP